MSKKIKNTIERPEQINLVLYCNIFIFNMLHAYSGKMIIDAKRFR